MEEYLKCMEELDEIAALRYEIVKREKRVYQEILDYGKKQYTYERRQQIIIQAKNLDDNEWTAQSLEKIHSKWEKGDCSYQDVMTFAEQDMNLLGYQASAFKESWVVRVRNFLIGEKGEDHE